MLCNGFPAFLPSHSVPQRPVPYLRSHTSSPVGFNAARYKLSVGSRRCESKHTIFILLFYIPFSKLKNCFLLSSSNLHYPGETSPQVIDCNSYTAQNCILHLPQGYFAIAPVQGPTDSLGVFYICLLFCWAFMAAYWHYAVWRSIVIHFIDLSSNWSYISRYMLSIGADAH